MNRLLLAAVLGGSILAGSTAAQAQSQTATTTFQVTATVQAACTVAATDMSFGTYTAQVSTVSGSGAVVNQTSAITVTCSNGAPYTVALNDGANASSGQRRMKNGTTNYLSYDLYSDSARSSRWGSSSGTVAGTGTGSGVAHTVYGQIAASQAVPPGSYADTITVTLTY